MGYTLDWAYALEKHVTNVLGSYRFRRGFRHRIFASASGGNDHPLEEIGVCSMNSAVSSLMSL